jgi:hypothetical protein
MNDHDNATIVITFLLLLPWLGRTAASAMEVWRARTASQTKKDAKLHAMLTDYSPLDVALFTEREAAAKWLSVPVEVLMAQR